jgi:hypothetical protein
MKRLLTEANLTNFTDLLTSINTVLDNKEIPQFAGSETNKVRDWFLKQYVSAIKNDEIDLKNAIKKHEYKDDEPEWMNKPDIMDFTGDLPEDVVDEIGHTVDYFATLEPNDLRKIYKEPYRVIKQKVQEWDRELAASATDSGKEDVEKKKLALGKDYKVVKQVGGMKWVKLLTPESKDVEGEFMGHCVGGAGYENKDIYSLWDSKNRSHVTIEADDNKKTIQQIKGKQNREPNEKYLPASIDFVANAMLQGYKIQGDGENVGMIKHNTDYHFDDLNVLPEKFRDKAVFRQWVDKIFPTEIFPKQQKAIADIAKRIVEV